MIDLLEAAAKNENNKDHTFFLDGDLNQMSAQKRFLSSIGIVTKQRNVYPCLKDEDVKKALTAIWTNKIDGWWNYLKEYVELEICTEGEFNDALRAA